MTDVNLQGGIPSSVKGEWRDIAQSIQECSNDDTVFCYKQKDKDGNIKHTIWGGSQENRRSMLGRCILDEMRKIINKEQNEH